MKCSKNFFLNGYCASPYPYCLQACLAVEYGAMAAKKSDSGPPTESFPRRTVRLGAAEERALRDEATKLGITESELMRRILREHFGL